MVHRLELAFVPAAEFTRSSDHRLEGGREALRVSAAGSGVPVEESLGPGRLCTGKLRERRGESRAGRDEMPVVVFLLAPDTR